MTKQTAVEWLGFELNLKLFFKVSEKEWDEINEVFKQALAMEREQIIEAWCDGFDEDNRATSNPYMYYNETYKGGEQ
jgi:predicted GNAT superfamily acetyltransferase